MKYLLFATCLLLAGCAYAQEPIYTPMKGNYKFKGLKADTLLLIPSFSDTTTANSTYLDAVPGAMIRCGNDFWMRNAGATAWLQNVNVGNGSSPAVNFVKKVYRKANRDSIFYIINPIDTQYAFTDRGFDTLRRSNDSVYAYRFGTKVFQFKDSGSAQLGDSPDRINGQSTKNVISDLNSYNIAFKSGNKFNVECDTISLKSNNIYFSNQSNGFVTIGSGKVIIDGSTYESPPSSQKNVDVSSADYTISNYGTYTITTGGTYDIILPDPASFGGRQISIFNTTGTDVDLDNTYNIYENWTNSNIPNVKASGLLVLTSDGDAWRSIIKTY